MNGIHSKVVESGAKRKPPAAGKGRKPGVPNKMTTAAKDAIAQTAEALGGAERMTAWARESPANERVFWGTIYPKLLPLQLSTTYDDPIAQMMKAIEGTQLKPKP